MRRFLVLGHTQPPAGAIPLQDAPGAGGRWDLLARCVTSGLLVSHGIRADTEVWMWLARGPRIVRAQGATIRRLNPDERSTLALLSKALEATDVGSHESAPLPGLATSRRTLDEVLSACARDGVIAALREDGDARLEDWAAPKGRVTFVLSDHQDPTAEEQAAIDRAATVRLNVGPVALQADQCITIVHNRLDRAPP